MKIIQVTMFITKSYISMADTCIVRKRHTILQPHYICSKYSIGIITEIKISHWSILNYLSLSVSVQNIATVQCASNALRQNAFKLDFLTALWHWTKDTLSEMFKIMQLYKQNMKYFEKHLASSIWWRPDMKTISTKVAFCKGIGRSPVVSLSQSANNIICC